MTKKLLAITLCIITFGFCRCTKVPGYPFLWRYPILEKTGEYTTRLLAVRKKKVEAPEVEGEFYLYYTTASYDKDSNYTLSTMILHFVPEAEGYKTRSMLGGLTFYKNGKDAGHGEPNGKWSNWSYGKDELLEYLLTKVDC